MDRAYEANPASSAPAPPNPPLLGYPAEGDSPTTPGAWWFHMVMEEMRAVIVAAGIQPSALVLNQLSAAVQTLISSAVSALKSLTLSSAGDGAVAGSNFNGGAPLKISYNSVGAPSTGGAGATGTWGIGISGNAATVTANNTAVNQSLSIALVATGGAGPSGLAYNNGVLVNPSTGMLTAPGFTATSDMRLKADFRRMTGALELLERNPPFIYNHKITKQPHRGTSAQGFQDDAPELVREIVLVHPKTRQEVARYLGVDVYGYAATNHQATLDLLAQLRELRAEVQALKEKR